jgi:hypothetical protein
VLSIHFLDVTNRDGVQTARTGLALAEVGAFGDLRLSGWCRAVPADVEAAVSIVVPGAGQGTQGLRHYNLSISTSDQMIAHKFCGKLDRPRSARR